ncbi:MAG: aldo/keto reductase [Lachnospiraceae bacterium]|nr:aldo/keto reductase [Lachnospiraceae bacterium]
MENRKLGQIEVSPIGMGCMGFSHGCGQIPEREYSIKAIQNAYDFGCTFFDTAESYGRELYYPGHNEEIVGDAIRPFRSHIVLATKYHIGENEEISGSLYDFVKAHLEASMERLHTDYVDLYYLHRLNERFSIEEIAEVMGQLIKAGLIRGWGLSQVSADTLKKANQVTPVSAVQNIYSMVERDCEKEIFPYCLQHGIGVVPFSPIASGFLSGKVTVDTKFEGDDVRKYVPQLSRENLIANQPILDVLAEFSKKKNATNAQISLAWMLHKYPNVVPIPGSKNRERILENLASWNITLSDGEFEQLETALNACVIHGHRGHDESEQRSFGKQWAAKFKHE